MMPRHANSFSLDEQSSDILLVAGSTPESGWERTLPLFERMGCALPSLSPQLEDWRDVATSSAVLSQPRVTTLKPGGHLRSVSLALLDACVPPVLLSVEAMGARPEFWLEELPSARLLMFHSRPEAALIAAMEMDQSLDEMLDRWAESAQILLHTFRQHRRRIAMMDVECALAEPVEFMQRCIDWLGLQPALNNTAPAMASRTGSDMQQLIASQMVAQEPHIARLIEELEACSLPIGEPTQPIYIDCAKVYAEHRARYTELDRLRLQLKRTQEASESARIERKKYEEDNKSLRTVQRELEAKVQSVSQLNQSRQEEIKALDAELKNLKLMRNEMAEENDLLLARLHQAQEEVEGHYQRFQINASAVNRLENKLKARDLRIQSSGNEIGKLKMKIKRQEERLSQIRGSRSWRITAPLRAMRRWFPGSQ